MNKIFTGGIAAITLAGMLAGGAIYSDRRLEAGYRGNFHIQDKRIRIDTRTFGMGLLEGKASWTLDFVPDLCQPERNAKIGIRSEDTIRRNFGGYTIRSKFYGTGAGAPEEMLFETVSTVGWTGRVQSTITIPAGSHTDKGAVSGKDIVFEWGETVLRFSFKREKDGISPPHIKFTAPLLRISEPGDPDTGLEIRQFAYTNDGLLLLNGIPQSGSTRLSAESAVVRLSGKDGNPSGSNTPIRLSISGLNLEGSLKNDGKTVGYHWKGSIAKAGANNAVFDGIRLNYAVTGLSADAVAKINSLIERQGHACVPIQEQSQIVEDAALAALGGGLRVASKGNRIRLENTSADADFEVSLSGIGRTAKEDIPAQIERSLNMQGRAAVDKDFIVKLFEALDGKKMSSEEKASFLKEIRPETYEKDGIRMDFREENGRIVMDMRSTER